MLLVSLLKDDVVLLVLVSLLKGDVILCPGRVQAKARRVRWDLRDPGDCR